LISPDGGLVGLPYRFILRRPFGCAFARALETLDALLLESVYRPSPVVGRDAQDPVQVDVVDASEDDDHLRVPVNHILLEAIDHLAAVLTHHPASIREACSAEG
jgi:hypothetical protein